MGKFILILAVFLSGESFAIEYSALKKDWEGSYSNSDLKTNILALRPGALTFKIVYLDSAYSVKEYRITTDQNEIFLDRIDVPDSAERHKKPYIVEGSITGLKVGDYKFIVRRKVHNGDTIVVLEQKVRIH
jgi:hypothetical protein